MAQQKKAKPPEPVGESAPMWIVSFADLVTLMMSFFVVLYAMELDGNKGKKDEFSAAVKIMAGVQPDPASLDPVDQIVNNYLGRPRPPQLDRNKGNADKTAKGIEGNNPEVTTIRPGKEMTTGGKILFEAGQAGLSDEAKVVVEKIAGLVRGHNNVLMIKGHISSDELVLRPDDPQGMGLSTRRAMMVADELVKHGIDRRVLRPVACGPFEPIKVGVYDAQGLQQNRRVEVYSTDYTISEYAPINTVPAPGEEGKHEAPHTAPTPTSEPAPAKKHESSSHAH